MTLVAPMAELEARMYEATSERLANVIVTPPGGDPFAARLSVSDRQAYDAAVSTHVLRYLDRLASLRDGDSLSIDGSTYRVMGHPERLNAFERTADLYKG